MVLNGEWVARQVQERLRKDPHGARARVLANEVRPGGENGEDWWLVPVEYQLDPSNAYSLFGLFSKIEDDLESSQVHVLLVPRALPPPPDAAA